MTMNHADAQASFKDASDSFSELGALFLALEEALKKVKVGIPGAIPPALFTAEGLIGCGSKLATDMADVSCGWASEAAEPWLEDAPTTPQAENKPVTTHVDAQPTAKDASENLTTDDLEARLMEIKVLVDSVDRMIWQDGLIGADESQLTDATYLTTIASRMLVDLWSRISFYDEIKPIPGRGDQGEQNNCLH